MSIGIEGASRFAAQVTRAAPLLDLANRSIGSVPDRGAFLVVDRATLTAFVFAAITGSTPCTWLARLS